ncbi:MAG: hypothetical protein GC153_03180 [Alphaproteobacteria bacterium]|nr:hypothetical protein [Alphaproteobacteria bacterium]
MSIGALALVLAVAAAGWLLWRSARAGESGFGARNVTLMKGVAFLALAAVLFAVKLMPIALMTLVAAGAVTVIEIWRERAIGTEASGAAPPAAKTAMQAEEAASILGVPLDAPPDAVRAAHRKLIGQLHPDKGGTDYLAAKINDAREVLLRRQGNGGV